MHQLRQILADALGVDSQASYDPDWSPTEQSKPVLYGAPSPAVGQPEPVDLGCWIVPQQLRTVSGGREQVYRDHLPTGARTQVAASEAPPGGYAARYDDRAFLTPLEVSESVLSTGKIINTYTGEIANTFEDTMPPPNRKAGDVVRENKNKQLRVDAMGGNVLNTYHKTEQENSLPPADSGPPNAAVTNRIAYDAHQEGLERAERDMYWTRRDLAPTEAQMTKNPIFFDGYNNLLRIAPYVPTTVQLDSKDWVPNASELPTNRLAPQSTYRLRRDGDINSARTAPAHFAGAEEVKSIMSEIRRSSTQRNCNVKTGAAPAEPLYSAAGLPGESSLRKVDRQSAPVSLRGAALSPLPTSATAQGEHNGRDAFGTRCTNPTAGDAQPLALSAAEISSLRNSMATPTQGFSTAEAGCVSSTMTALAEERQVSGRGGALTLPAEAGCVSSTMTALAEERQVSGRGGALTLPAAHATLPGTEILEAPSANPVASRSVEPTWRNTAPPGTVNCVEELYGDPQRPGAASTSDAVPVPAAHASSRLRERQGSRRPIVSFHASSLAPSASVELERLNAETGEATRAAGLLLQQAMALPRAMTVCASRASQERAALVHAPFQQCRAQTAAYTVGEELVVEAGVGAVDVGICSPQTVGVQASDVRKDVENLAARRSNLYADARPSVAISVSESRQQSALVLQRPTHTGAQSGSRVESGNSEQGARETVSAERPATVLPYAASTVPGDLLTGPAERSRPRHQTVDSFSAERAAASAPAGVLDSRAEQLVDPRTQLVRDPGCAAHGLPAAISSAPDVNHATALTGAAGLETCTASVWEASVSRGGIEEVCSAVRAVNDSLAASALPGGSLQVAAEDVGSLCHIRSADPAIGDAFGRQDVLPLPTFRGAHAPHEVKRDSVGGDVDMQHQAPRGYRETRPESSVTPLQFAHPVGNQPRLVGAAQRRERTRSQKPRQAPPEHSEGGLSTITEVPVSRCEEIAVGR